MSDLADALRRVRDRVAAACERAGRPVDTVELVAVAKTVAAESVRKLLACGHDLFGENRVQEALRKQPLVGSGARWHLVGHLQRNKARHAVGAFELIHSVDSVELARELAKRATRAGRAQAALVQVNVSRESTKHGVDEESLNVLVDSILELPGLDLLGLMTIPPPVKRAEESRAHFVRLRELRDRAATRAGIPLGHLSMGMTDDFEVAIEEGATLVRVGRAIFGERSGPGAGAHREQETVG